MTQETYLKALLEKFFDQGCFLGFTDEEGEQAIEPCQDVELLIAEILDLEEVALQVFKEGKRIGYVLLIPDVKNSEPEDIVCDFTEHPLIAKIIEGFDEQ